MDILHTQHWNEGDNGKYFYFNEREFGKMVGNEDWNGKRFSMIQNGFQFWSGKVIVWKGDSRTGAHGKRDQKSMPGQWESGDTIKLMSCEKVKIISAIFFIYIIFTFTKC